MEREAFGMRELAPAFRPAAPKSAGKPPHSKRFAPSGATERFVVSAEKR